MLTKYLLIFAFIIVIFVQFLQCEEEQKELNPLISSPTSSPTDVEQNFGKRHTWIHKVDIFKWGEETEKPPTTETHKKEQRRKRKKQRKSNNVLNSTRVTENVIQEKAPLKSGYIKPAQLRYGLQEVGTRNLVNEPRNDNVEDHDLFQNRNNFPLLRYFMSTEVPATANNRKSDVTLAKKGTQSSRNHQRRKKKSRKNSRTTAKSPRIRFPGKRLRSLIRNENKTASWPRRNKAQRTQKTTNFLKTKIPGNVNKILLVSPIFSFKMDEPRRSLIGPHHGRRLPESIFPDPLIIQRHNPQLNFHHSIPIYQPVCLSRLFFSNMARDDVGMTKPFNLMNEMERLRKNLVEKQKVTASKWYADSHRAFYFPPLSIMRGPDFEEQLPGPHPVMENTQKLPDDINFGSAATERSLFPQASSYVTAGGDQNAYQAPTDKPEPELLVGEEDFTVVPSQLQMTETLEKETSQSPVLTVPTMNVLASGDKIQDNANNSVNASQSPTKGTEKEELIIFPTRNDIHQVQYSAPRSQLQIIKEQISGKTTSNVHASISEETQTQTSILNGTLGNEDPGASITPGYNEAANLDLQSLPIV